MALELVTGENVATAVGFAGVMLTLWFNAWQERRQHDRQVQHERSALTRAFLAELRRNLETFDYNLERTPNDPPDGDLAFTTQPRTAVYDQLLGQIGYLEDHHIGPVVQAYSMIRAVPERMLLAIALEDGTPAIPVDGYVIVPARLVPILRAILQNARDLTAAAIAALEGRRSPADPLTETFASIASENG